MKVAIRSLVSQHRSVPVALHDRYDTAWAALQREVEARGAHAWRFTSANNPARFVEFLEFGLSLIHI